jgi:Na+(H+)/acetate symporter ActP
MSDQPQPSSSDTWIKVLCVVMILVGGVMLLPGICAGFFAVMAVQQPHDPYLSGWMQLWLACFTVSLAGVGLIVWAVRRLRR